MTLTYLKRKIIFAQLRKKLPKLDRSNFGNHLVVQFKQLPRVLQSDLGKKQEKTNMAW